ncbi:MAG: flavodoxin domain-containing protein [Candidatus Thorarchaeota archaeon]|nr:MAG: flavodoxin domain-containing protein [Candidatus Thorarchaeota archaeon]
MKQAIIVYESKYGNTKRIAEAIGQGIRASGEIECVVVATGEIHTGDLSEYDAVLFGCPNHNQAPSRGMLAFIGRASIVDLDGKLTTVFDTYMGRNKGVAMAKLEAEVREKLSGLRLLEDGFSAKVKNRDGPLEETEIPQAIEFGKAVAQRIKS